MAFNIRAYLAQPTTIAGLSGIAATITGVAAHLVTHDITVPAAIAAITASVVAVLLPDNSAAQSSLEKLMRDAVQAEAQKRVQAAFPTLFADGMAVAQALAPGSTVIGGAATAPGGAAAPAAQVPASA